MRRGIFGLYTLAFALLASSVVAASESQVAVAIRYLQAKGVSHSHVFLFREDGQPIRQLTRDDSGQDFDPIFAPDGETIVFRRELAGDVIETWSVQRDGKNLRRLAAAPAWYTAARTAPIFTDYESEPAEPASTISPDAGEKAIFQPQVWRAPDDSVEVVVRRLETDEDDSINGIGTGKHFLLRDLKAGTEMEMGSLPGFEGLWDVLHLRREPKHVFFFEGALRLVFFGLHLNSTDGGTVYALDLQGRRLVRLSPNWAAPIPLPGEAAFLTLSEVRYVPISGSMMTANCSYLERWNARLEAVRYAREKAAAVCYGASVYRRGLEPIVIIFRKSGE